MEVGRHQGPDPSRPHQRFAEARLELLRSTRARLLKARMEAARIGQEQSERRQANVESNQEAVRRRLEHLRDRFESAREAQKEAREAPRRDSVQISNSAREALARAGDLREDGQDEVFRPKIERLKNHFQARRLNTPERVERAADQMLRGAGISNAGVDAAAGGASGAGEKPDVDGPNTGGGPNTGPNTGDGANV